MTYQPRNPNGQAVMANSEPVVIASDQTSIPIDDDGGSITVDDGGGSITVDAATGATGLAKAYGGSFVGTNEVGVLMLAVNEGTSAYAPVFVDTSLRLLTTVNGVIPGTAANNLGKAEDAPHASGDTGVFVLGVASSSATVYGTSGDYTPISVDTAGRVRVHGASADDAAVGGDVVLVGGRASAAIPTAKSADGDAVYSYMDRVGRRVVTQKAGTSTLSNVSGSASSVTVLAANTSRLGATIYNDSTAVLYLKFGTTASTTSFTVKLQPDDYYEVPFGYTGTIDGIWASATGAARVTELT